MSRQINLFNPAFEKRKKSFSALAMVQAFGLVMAGTLILYFYAVRQVEEAEKQENLTAKRLEAERGRLEKTTKEIVSPEKNTALLDEIRRLENQAKVRGEELAILQGGGIGKGRGFSDFMRAQARQHVEGLWLTGFRIADGGNEVTLEGRTLQPELVPVYIQRLKQEPVMQGLAFATLEMSRPKMDPVAKDKSAAVGYLEFSLRSGEPGHPPETR